MLQSVLCVAGICAEVEMGKKPAIVTSATAHAEGKRYEPHCSHIELLNCLRLLYNLLHMKLLFTVFAGELVDHKKSPCTNCLMQSLRQVGLCLASRWVACLAWCHCYGWMLLNVKLRRQQSRGLKQSLCSDSTNARLPSARLPMLDFPAHVYQCLTSQRTSTTWYRRI